MDLLTADAFVIAIEAIKEFSGTSAELLAKVGKPEKAPSGWPANARAVTQLLRRQAPVMRKAGWQVEGDQNRKGITIWTIRPRARDAGNPDRQDRQDSTNQGLAGAGHAGDAGQAAGNAGQADHSQQADFAGFAGLAGQECAPSLDDACTHCGQPETPGDLVMPMTIAGEKVRLHRRCFNPYQDAGLDIPPALDRRRETAG